MYRRQPCLSGWYQHAPHVAGVAALMRGLILRGRRSKVKAALRAAGGATHSALQRIFHRRVRLINAAAGGVYAC